MGGWDPERLERSAYRAAIGQLLQYHALAIDPLGVAGIAAADDLIDEAAIGDKIVEVK